jgi:hypothetical protein
MGQLSSSKFFDPVHTTREVSSHSDCDHSSRVKTFLKVTATSTMAGQHEVALAGQPITRRGTPVVRRSSTSLVANISISCCAVHPGSSTGSAVGVSAGFAPASIGTETCGSIGNPASSQVSDR